MSIAYDNQASLSLWVFFRNHASISYMVLFGLWSMAAVPPLDSGKGDLCLRSSWTFEFFMLPRNSQHRGTIQARCPGLDQDPHGLWSFLFQSILQPSPSYSGLTMCSKELWDCDYEIVLGVHSLGLISRKQLGNQRAPADHHNISFTRSHDFYFQSNANILTLGDAFSFWTRDEFMALVYRQSTVNHWDRTTSAIACLCSEYGAASGHIVGDSGGGSRSPLPCVLSITATQEVPQYSPQVLWHKSHSSLRVATTVCSECFWNCWSPVPTGQCN